MTGRQALEPDIWLDRHGDALFRYALVRLRDHSLAEEMVQETLLAALQSHDKFAGQSSERTWLVGILKHKIVDHFRRLSRERPADPDPISPEVAQLFDESGYWHHDQGPVDWGADPARDFERMEFQKILDRCLSELPQRTATAFALREMEEMTSEEICKVMGVTTTNLWVMLHRARAHMRHCLEMKWFGNQSRRN
ncbi:MAG: sigma-70 family RNA polymerase sigma factor [Acidobacteriota bacterium]